MTQTYNKYFIYQSNSRKNQNQSRRIGKMPQGPSGG
jgi:hypothetical protein